MKCPGVRQMAENENTLFYQGEAVLVSFCVIPLVRNKE